MEITIGDYGRMMFEIMSGKYKDMPDHWKSISAKAKPLVSELIKLNSEMKGEGPYEIVEYVENGKEKLSEYKRIQKTQNLLWGIEAGKLKIGDFIWINNSKHEMYIGEQDPATIIDITKNGIYVEIQGCGGEYIIVISHNEKVLKAPEDFNENENIYIEKQYWLEKAKEYDI